MSERMTEDQLLTLKEVASVGICDPPSVKYMADALHGVINEALALRTELAAVREELAAIRKKPSMRRRSILALRYERICVLIGERDAARAQGRKDALEGVRLKLPFALRYTATTGTQLLHEIHKHIAAELQKLDAGEDGK